MKVNISGKNVSLKDKDVDIAYKLVNSFLSSVRNNAISHNKLPVYLTTLAVMYVASANMLKYIDPNLAEIISKMEDKDDD